MNSRFEDPSIAGANWVRCPGAGQPVRLSKLTPADVSWRMGEPYILCWVCQNWTRVTKSTKLVSHWVAGGPLFETSDIC